MLSLLKGVQGEQNRIYCAVRDSDSVDGVYKPNDIESDRGYNCFDRRDICNQRGGSDNGFNIYALFCKV
jgi:hypothetical protein